MAQPSGSILPSDMGYDITSAGDTRDETIFYSYAYAVCKVDLQPDKWAPVNREDIYHAHEVSILPYIAASGELNATVRIGKETPDANAVFSESGAYIAYVWMTSETEDIYTNRTYQLPNYNETKIVPRYTIIELKVSRNITSDLSETVKLYHMFFNAVNDGAYAGNDAIAFNSDVVSQRVNNPFDSLSSFLLKDAIAENLNKIMYSSKNTFTIPLFGDY